MGDNISTVEGIQYTGGRILISACLVINNDENISTFFCITIRNFHSEVQPCFGIIDNSSFGMLSLSLLKLTVFVTARDIYSFLTLSNRLRNS